MKTILAMAIMTAMLYGANAAEFADLCDIKASDIATPAAPVPVGQLRTAAPDMPQETSGMEDRLVLAGFSASQAKRIIRYSNGSALNLLEKSNNDGLTPISVCRGVNAPKSEYDPKKVGSWGGIVAGNYYYKFWTSTDIDVCTGFAEKSLVLKLRIPKLFLIFPCDKFACVFDRSLAADDRAFILQVATFSGSDLVWTDYDSAFNTNGDLKI